MNRIPGQIILRATHLAGRVHAVGLLETPGGSLPSEHAAVIADVGQGLQLSVAQPVEPAVAEALAAQKLGDISFNTEAWFLENSVTEGQLFFRTTTMPPSREGREIVAFSGMLRVRGGTLPALDQLHEISINPANHAIEILSAPATYAQIIGNVVPGQPDVLFALPIWGFGIETVGLRSTFRADVQMASDRAQELLARERGHGEALSEEEDAELVTLLSGPAGLLVGPAPFDKTPQLDFDAWFAAALGIRGLAGMQLAGVRNFAGFNAFMAENAQINAAMAEALKPAQVEPSASDPEAATVH